MPENPYLLTSDLLKLEIMTPKRIKAIRKLYGLTQVAFSDLLRVKYNTYRSWEGGYKYPSSPACALLYVAEKCPKTFLENKDSIISLVNKNY
jgi:DNA-binding transcriptional regulator YiaG